jgi:hypothetical protein
MSSIRSKIQDAKANHSTTPTDVGTNPEQLLWALPTEIWLLITSFVENKKDLFTLCGTSKRLRLITLPLVFGTVKLGHDMARMYHQMTRRYTSLQNPQLAVVVTEFRVRIWEPRCKRGTPCTACDTLDVIIGNALLAMVNLEALDIACQLCLVPPEFHTQRHSYMPQLPTRRLRTFNFHCRHCSGESLGLRESIISSPCLATVHSFSYGPDVRHSATDPGSLALIDSGTMQTLRDMQFYGTAVDGQILATRPIERLVIQTWLPTAPGKKERLDTALLQSPGKLTHLIGWNWVLSTEPTFKYLRHIGTITSNVCPFGSAWVNSQQFGLIVAMKDRHIISYMDNLTHLKYLTSIDVGTHPSHRFAELGSPTCSRLREIFPTFRKVLLHGSYCGIWELQGATWTKRDVEDFSVWDIIRGGCDNL